MKNKPQIKKKIKTGGKLSERLKIFVGEVKQDSITVGDMRDMFSGSSYWLLMFIFALPLLIPLPTPGLSAVVSVPLVLVAAQLVLGRKSPWLPSRIAKKKLQKESLKKSIKKVEPYLKKIEVVVRQRAIFLTKPPIDRIIALICTALSVLMMLPLPFSNAFPALAICVLSLAMVMKDGVFVIIGIVMGAASAGLVWAISEGVVSGVEELFSF